MAILCPLWGALRKVFHFIGRVTTVILLTTVYFVIFLPLGAVLRVFNRAPLAAAGGAASTWKHRPAEDTTLDGAERPF